jgi:hypothetical protein
VRYRVSRKSQDDSYAQLLSSKSSDDKAFIELGSVHGAQAFFTRNEERQYPASRVLKGFAPAAV